jgi:hypothetical protein
LIFFLRTTEHNLTKLGMNDPDYARAITPIRGRPYGDFCRAFDAEEGRSPLFFSIGEIVSIFCAFRKKS